MKRLLVLLLFLALSCAVENDGEIKDGQCENKNPLDPRPHSVSLLEFGAVGDGKTLNTVAFQNAIFYVKSFADKGGAQLYIPAGRWLTKSFNLTSHLTLFLEAGATILGSQDYAHWDIVEPLPSYGRGTDLPGWSYRSLINGYNLSDVVITGDNGTIDGQGSVWWEQFSSFSLNYSRPHLVEFTGCSNVTISNLTLLNSPAWSIHPTYCRYVQVLNVTVHASPASPYTSGIVPDSSENVCIVNCNISMGHDAIVLKSGWDQYGIAYGKPTKNVHIRGVRLQSSGGSGLAFGSEMSGGISNVLVEQLHVHNSVVGIALKTARGRGGYMKDIIISNAEMEDVHIAIQVSGQSDSHPDDKFDPNELPVVRGITFENIVGTHIGFAGYLSGLEEASFTSICLSNVSFSMTSDSSMSWFCSNVMGFSVEVFPKPCSNLQDSTFNSSSACLISLNPRDYVATL